MSPSSPTPERSRTSSPASSEMMWTTSSTVIMPTSRPSPSTTAAETSAYFWKRSATSSWSMSTGISVCSRAMTSATGRVRGVRRIVDSLQVPTGGFLGIAQRLLDRGAVVGLHLLEDGLLVVAVEVLDQRDGVVGVELPGDVRDLLRLHLVDEAFADEIVHLREHVRADDPGERLDQPLALVVGGELDQVGDVGRVERLDELARGPVIAGLDRVEHAADELGPKPVLGIDDGARIARGRGGDVLALAHDAPLA